MSLFLISQSISCWHYRIFLFLFGETSLRTMQLLSRTAIHQIGGYRALADWYSTAVYTKAGVVHTKRWLLCRFMHGLQVTVASTNAYHPAEPSAHYKSSTSWAVCVESDAEPKHRLATSLLPSDLTLSTFQALTTRVTRRLLCQNLSMKRLLA